MVVRYRILQQPLDKIVYLDGGISQDAKRTIRLKIIYQHGDKVRAEFSFTRPNDEAAIAYYLFMESSLEGPPHDYQEGRSFMEMHKYDCETCRNPQTTGPFMECISYDKELKGACLNCYYSGRATRCSRRKGRFSMKRGSMGYCLMDAEYEEAENRGLRTMKAVKEELENATMRELEAWAPVIEAELSKRAQARAAARTQASK